MSDQASQEAEAKIAPVRSNLNIKVYDLIKERGGLTYDQVEDILGVARGTVVARFGDLLLMGCVQKSGRFALSRKGNRANIYEVTELNGPEHYSGAELTLLRREAQAKKDKPEPGNEWYRYVATSPNGSKLLIASEDWRVWKDALERLQRQRGWVVNITDDLSPGDIYRRAPKGGAE